MPLLRSTILAAALTGAIGFSGSVILGSHVYAAGIENPGGMNLQSADPAGQTKAPKVKRKPQAKASLQARARQRQGAGQEVRASVH